MPRGRAKQATEAGAAHGTFPEGEKLTDAQQQALIDFLQEAAQEIGDQFDEELTRLQQSAAQGRMLARRDAHGLSRQPMPPVPDIKRDGPYEKLVLDTHRLVTYFAYLHACQAHLSSQGFDIGVGMVEYLHARTAGLAEAEVKAFAHGLKLAASAKYMELYNRAVTVFPEQAMQRVLDWDEASRQQDSWFDRLRRLLREA
jgi:hypothetical protein